MAVAFDAGSESHTGTTGSTSEASFNWTHTPSGTPKGVVVAVINASSAADTTTSVTYGGTSMTAVTGGYAEDTIGEPGSCKLYFLGSSVPTGAQTVVVNRTNNADVMYAIASTVTASSDTDYAGVFVEEENQARTEENVDDGSPGSNSVRFCFGYSGEAGIAGSDVGANSTLIHAIDLGSQNAFGVYETTAGQGSRPVGLANDLDDTAFVYLAVIEGTAGTPPTVDAGGPYSGSVSTAISLDGTVTPGSDGSPTYLWEIVSGGTGTFGSATSVDTTFTPDAIATYVLRLTVSTSDTPDVIDTATLTSAGTGVAYDAYAESHTGTTASTSEASFNWTHTPTGTPRGALVFVIGNGSETDIISGVTYGGSAMTAIGLAQDSATEPGFCKAYFLGSSIPTGAQSVVVSRTNNATEVYGISITATASGDTSYAGLFTEENNQVLTEENVDDGSPGSSSLRIVGLYHGAGSISGAAGDNSTYIQGIDWGEQQGGAFYETTTGQGARPVGIVKPSADDVAAIYLAIIEPAGTAPTVDAGGPYEGEVSTAISLNATITPGTDASPTYLWEVVSGGTGAFSDATDEDPTFTPDDIGTYTLRLTVSTVDNADVIDTCVLDSTDTAGAWVLTNGTAALDETGLEGVASTASTLTATSANCTAIASAVTMASGTHTGRFYLKRITGTGDVDISVDGGSTWETVTLTASFQAFYKEQSSLENPSLGIRIVTSGDEVALGNAELYLNTTEADISGIEHIYTYASIVTAYREAPSEQMGAWTASTGWTTMPGNSLYWPLNDESGDTLDEANG